MDYIAVIDYEHLDNGIFLAAFARAVSQQQNARGLFIHSDSAYTERLIQTGLMREEATVRAIRDLNYRLIALFADHGVSAIGLNGHQRSLLQQKESGLTVNRGLIDSLPGQTHLLLSGLAVQPGLNHPAVVGLPALASLLQKTLNIPEIVLFSTEESDEVIRRELPETLSLSEPVGGFPTDRIPEAFQSATFPFRLATAERFSDWPPGSGTTLVVP